MAEEVAEGGGVRERKILVAVDEGEESAYALSWCLKNLVSENNNSKDTLILLYAKPPRVVYSALDGTGRRRKFLPDEGYLFSPDVVASMDKYSNEVAEAVIGKAKRLCREAEGVKVESRVEHGDPRDVICEAAEKLGVDVVVMGSHGYGIIKRAFLGSVSNHCAQNIKCPVLIVKRPKPSSSSSATHHTN